MQKQNIDVIGAELSKACLDRLPQPGRGELAESCHLCFLAAHQPAYTRHLECSTNSANRDPLHAALLLWQNSVFGSDNSAVSLPLKELAKHSFRPAEPITLRRIEESDS